MGIYPATPDYIHALEVQKPNRIVYVSGTMGLDAGGVAGETLEEQLALVWSNIRVILASAGMTVAKKRIEYGPGGTGSLVARPDDFIHLPKGLMHREGNPSEEVSYSIALRLGRGPATINVEGPS